ncbi:hypothetical protein FRC07_005394 [Ceratobasidium sp. 392]|nr:hypothetical protein FRC07_005394 [Ceratobasidium sp. 392]
MLNSLDDSCLWGPPDPNSLIGDTKSKVIAWCTRPGRGSRLIPKGAHIWVQFMKTSAYVQVTGVIRQELINIDATDIGGQLDPHGADQRGSPVGSLRFSNAFASNNGNSNPYQQVVEWHSAMGAAVFCLKARDPVGPGAARFYNYVYNQIGCAYNSPAAYKNNTFESREGENQDFVGVYTSGGQVLTFTQPVNEPIAAMPYVPKIPASSSCVVF